jgi:hypothetical protein
MSTDTRTIVILDGGRRTPRADILVNNKEPGLFSRFLDHPARRLRDRRHPGQHRPRFAA